MQNTKIRLRNYSA